MSDITIGQFFPGNSVIHKMDPRTKILFTLCFMIMIFLVKSPLGLLTEALFTALIIAASGVPAKYYFKGMKPLLFIIMFTAVLNLFLTKGEVLYEVPYLGWSITDKGLSLSVFMVIRLTVLFTSASALTFTTSPVVLTNGIEALLRPFSKIGVPANEIAMMISIALRFIPTFAEEADKIKMAQSARGADFETGSIVKRAKAMIPILIPLFVGAFRRADELAVAMEARCYKGGEGRTSLKRLAFGRADVLALFAFLVLTALTVSAEILF